PHTSIYSLSPYTTLFRSNRKEDIHLLFRKFASDFAQKYKMPTIRLEDDAVELLKKYRWSGNVRQLRNVAEQISVLEQKRTISIEDRKSTRLNSSHVKTSY